MRNKKGEKIPDEWIICPSCQQFYGWVNCRITLSNPRRDKCLGCAIVDETESASIQALALWWFSEQGSVEGSVVVAPRLKKTP